MTFDVTYIYNNIEEYVSATVYEQAYNLKSIWGPTGSLWKT